MERSRGSKNRQEHGGQDNGKRAGSQSHRNHKSKEERANNVVVFGKALRQTGIPIREDKYGNHLIEDGDVKDFIKKQLKREDLTICSYWTR